MDTVLVNSEEIIKEVEATDEKNINDLYEQLGEIQTESRDFQRKNIKLSFLWVGIGGFIGFLSSYGVAILTAQELPKVIFTNGTVIFP